MNIDLEPGKYVVAVSGGVDSIVLLHLLMQKPDVELVVAHFDHGIRADSELDKELVEQIAKAHGLKFESEQGGLGAKASEATAREARYKFLTKVFKSSKAKAILTAHHQDDLVETALINLIRGTHRKGLSSLKNTELIKRPMLGLTKSQIKDYAVKHGLVWREDSTNKNQKYLRNKIRTDLAKSSGVGQRKDLVGIISNLQKLNEDIDEEITELLMVMSEGNSLNKAQFIKLSHDMSKEVLAHWLRSLEAGFDRKSLERLVGAIKTLPVGKKLEVDRKHFIKLTKTDIILSTREVNKTK